MGVNIVRNEMLQYMEKCVRGTADFPLSQYRYVRRERLITPHWHPEIEILYMVKGKMTIQVAENTYVLKEGDVLFVNPGELHAMDAREYGAEYYVTVFFPSLFQLPQEHFFMKEFMTPLVEGEIRFPRCVVKGDLEYESIKTVIHRMFCEHSESKALIFLDLLILFTELKEKALVENTETNAQYLDFNTIKRVISYMEDNFSTKLTLKQLADEAHMSPNYFCSYFKKYVGVSPFTQLNYIRIKKAENMLASKDMSIVSIAEACGFGNVSFFIRKFKEIIGCTPYNYKTKLRQNSS